MARVGLVGTGEIAQCLVTGLAGRGHVIFVSNRTRTRADDLANRFPDVQVCENQSVLDEADIVWLTLRGDDARALLPQLTFRPDHRIISAMMGVSHNDLIALCAPASDIAITIPMPFIATGKSPLPVYPPSPALVELFGDSDTVLPVASEAALSAHFAATALASPLFAQLAATAEWLGAVTGDRTKAESYVATLFGGYLASISNDGQNRFAEQLQALSTEGGLNATFLGHMKDHGLLTTLEAGLDRLRPKLGLPSQKT